MKFFESIERPLRNWIVYPFLRSLLRNPVRDKPVDLGAVERMLIFRHDRIGDMIVTLPVFRALKRRAPGMRLVVLASKSNAELAQNCGWVDEVLTLGNNWFRLPSQVLDLRRRRFDVVMNFVFNQTTTPAILANLIAPNGTKVGQGPDRYAFYFNRIVQLPRFRHHMSEQLAIFVSEIFGITISEEELQPALDVPAAQQAVVDEWLRTNCLHRRGVPGGESLPYVVFNLSAKGWQRRISVEQGALIAAHLGAHSEFRTVMVYAPDDSLMRSALDRHSEFERCLSFRTLGRSPLHQLASLIGGAIAVITPDTSIVHFASAMKTPLLAMYGEYQGAEWEPYRVLHHIIRSEHGAPASGIAPSVLVRKIDEFIAEVINDRKRV